MKLQKFLILVYLYSLLTGAFSAISGLDKQILLRMPLINIRWIDIVILIYVFMAIKYLPALISNSSGHKKLSKLQTLILTYLLFELVQFARTFGVIDFQSQVSWLLSTLGFSILLITFREYDVSDFHRLLINFAVTSSLVVYILILLELYGLKLGVAFQSEEGRLTLMQNAQKESVSASVLYPFIFTFSLISSFIKIVSYKKTLIYLSILPILIIVIVSFHRGTLAMVIITTIFFVPTIKSKSNKSFKYVGKLLKLTSILLVLFILFSDSLSSIGFNPIDKLEKVALFSVDVDNSNWDKGRFYVQAVLLGVWEKNILFGVGYDSHERYLPTGSAAHNFFVSSLFHRGLIGTFLLSWIFLLCYIKAFKLWRLSAKLNDNERLINRALVFTAFLWIIPLMTQEVMWEKYSTSIQFFYFSVIISLYEYYNNKKSEITF